MSRRLLWLVGTQARTATLVTGALALGASGAMALGAPSSLLVAPASQSSDVEVTPPETTTDDGTPDDELVTTTAEPTLEPTEEPTLDVHEQAPQVEVEDETDEDVVDTHDVDGTDATRDEPAASVDPVSCDEARNHGEYVSGVARSTEPGPGKGATVSEAARSDCGKDAEEVRETEEPETEEPGAGRSTAPGQAKKAGKGQG